MRHGISGNRFGRNSSWREATVRDIAKATLFKERICTTKAKAKEARKLAERLITMGKKGTLAQRRRAFAILCNHKLVSELFNVIAPRFRQRVGGYTRIIPLGFRRGDNAQLVYLELTERKPIEVKKSPKVLKGKVIETTKVDTAKEADLAEEKLKTDSVKVKQPKPTSKSIKQPKEQEKSGKKGMSGIQKIFRRKTAE